MSFKSKFASTVDYDKKLKIAQEALSAGEDPSFWNEQIQKIEDHKKKWKKQVGNSAFQNGIKKASQEIQNKLDRVGVKLENGPRIVKTKGGWYEIILGDGTVFSDGRGAGHYSSEEEAKKVLENIKKNQDQFLKYSDEKEKENWKKKYT